MTRRLELVVDQTGCSIPQWGDGLSIAYGLTDGYLRRSREVAECYPKNGRLKANVASVLVWAGESEQALDLLRQITETRRGDHDRTQEVQTLLSLGRVDEAERFAHSNMSDPAALIYAQAAVAAYREDVDEARRALEEFRQVPDRQRVREVMMLAAMGDREGANAAAAKIDEHPYGYITLPMIVQFCGCGAPWDIDATPNFKARFNETGLEWPPSSPIDFPMKDW